MEVISRDILIAYLKQLAMSPYISAGMSKAIYQIKRDIKELPHIVVHENNAGLSEQDLRELDDRYGEEVRATVEDMISGKGERWKK